MAENVQDLLKIELDNIAPELFVEAVKMDFNRDQSLTYLRTKTSAPLVIRKSSKEGYLSLDIFTENSNDCDRYLIAPPDKDHAEFHAYRFKDGIMTPVASMASIVKNAWDLYQKEKAEKTAKEAEVAANQKAIIDQISSLNLDISLDVFQFNFSREQAEKNLKDNQELPFIIRKSSKPGLFCLTYRNGSDFKHSLFETPNEVHSDFKFCIVSNDTQTKEFVTNSFDTTITGCVELTKIIPIDEAAEQAIKDYVSKLNLNLPPEAFQFNFNFDQAADTLKRNPALPFIIRKSDIKGLFCLSYRPLNTTSIHHVLIEPPNKNHPDYKFCHIEGKVKTILEEEFDEILLKRTKEQQQEQNAWKQFKEQQKSTTNRAAVLSVQSLDNENVVLAASELSTFKSKTAGLHEIGDGHTGFALASALDAPLVVIQPHGSSTKIKALLKERLVNNGFVVITGHGQVDGTVITGNYLDVALRKTTQVERTPSEIVATIMQSGTLKKGDHLTLLLSVCYSAAANDSIAHKLAKEFAKQGISTTIIASDKPVKRFSYSAIINENRMLFSSTAGMAPEDVCVFTTKVTDVTEDPTINIHRPNEAIRLDKDGLNFLTPLQLKIQTKLDTETEVRVVAMKENQALLGLFNKIHDMGLYGMQLAKTDSAKSEVVAKLAIDLNEKLEGFLEQSVKNKPTPEDVDNFKSDFADLLHSQNTIMETHREQWKPIVANILIALTVVGLFAIIAKAIAHVVDARKNDKPLSFNNSFFFAKTNSQILSEEVGDALDATSFETENEPSLKKDYY